MRSPIRASPRRIELVSTACSPTDDPTDDVPPIQEEEVVLGEPPLPRPPPLQERHIAPQFNVTVNMTTNVNVSGTNSHKLAAQWFRYGQSSTDIELPAKPYNTDRFVSLASEVFSLPQHSSSVTDLDSDALVREVLDTVDCALKRKAEAAAAKSDRRH